MMVRSLMWRLSSSSISSSWFCEHLRYIILGVNIEEVLMFSLVPCLSLRSSSAAHPGSVAFRSHVVASCSICARVGVSWPSGWMVGSVLLLDRNLDLDRSG